MRSPFRSIAVLLGLTMLVSTGFPQSFSGLYPFIGSAQAQVAVTAPVGTTAGSFQVNGNGGANYTIPIEVPPGRSGIQPQLSLQYNSQQTNGLLGMGWSLTGLPAIARCPKTIAQDGAVGGINFDNNDRFCLDGQRLVAVSGNYGANGTEYRTERESWMKIVSHGSAGSGPASFTAVAKDGSQIEFGNTVDSRIKATGKSDVRVWAVNKVTDRNGNYLKVTYTDDQVNGEYYPATIQYTGNDNGYVPQRKVQFIYEGRTDTSTAYMAGSIMKSTKRLKTVQTYVGTTLVKQYNLAYEYGQATGRSRMTSVQECGSDGVCLPKTKFGWNLNPALGIISSPNSASDGLIKSGWCSDNRSSWSDFNGDGLEDLHCDEDGDHFVLVSDGKGNLTAPPKSISKIDGLIKTNWCGDSFSSWSDFNGDGLQDLHCDQNGNHLVLISDGTGTLAPPPNRLRDDGLIKSGGWCDDLRSSWSDFNGDGLEDLHCDEDGDHFVLVSDGKGNLTAPPKSISKIDGLIKTNWCGDSFSSWSDFNGDGLQDLHCDQNGNHLVLISDGTGTLAPPPNRLRDDGLIKSGGWCDDLRSSWSDFNGDGLEDLHCDEDGDHFVLVSDGTGTLTSLNVFNEAGLIIAGFGCGDNRSSWSDFNGDGLEDSHCDQDGKHYVMVSNGRGVSTAPPNSLQSDGLIKTGWCNNRSSWSDFDGDGLEDLHCDQGGRHYVLINQAVTPDHLTSITNGLGSQTLVEYKPLTDRSVYTKGSGAQFPVFDIQVPMVLVSRHTIKESASSSTSFIYDHQYETARTNIHRGWEGFQKTILIDQQNNTKTITTHYIDFPLTGMIQERRIEDQTNNTKILGITIWNYKSKKEANNVYKIWLDNSTVNNYSEGTYNYTLGSAYTYDSDHRNITRVWHKGDQSNTKEEDDFYTCTQYHSGTGDYWWQASFPKATKRVRIASACGNWGSWSSTNDLTWQEYGYSSEGRMNLAIQRVWDDSKNKFIATSTGYDAYGNITSVTDALGNTSTIAHDDTYHTFPVTRTTPAVANAPSGLTVTTEFEPKFGIKTKITDANGIVSMQIPADGIDSMGRVVKVEGAKPDGTLVTLGTTQFSTGGKEFPILTNAAQSSNYSSSSSLARVAIDGNTSGNSEASVTSTNEDAQAWWQAETSVESPIGVVTIYNRTDCCGERLSDFYLIVSKDPFGSKSLAGLLAEDTGSEYTDRMKAVHFPGVAGAQVSLNIGGFRGKYVRVQLNGTNYLSLAEVKVGVFEVWGKTIITTKNRTAWAGTNTPDSTWLWSKEYIDGLGRSTKTVSRGYAVSNGYADGVSLISGEVEFNSKGQVEKSYLPYYVRGYDNCTHDVPLNESGQVCGTYAKQFSSHEYDIHGRPTRTTAPNGAIEERVYNLHDDRQVITKNPDPTQLSDNNLVDWTEHYTSRGRVEERIAPDGKTEQYGYDILGRVTRVTDPLGQVSTTTYNSLGQVTRKVHMELGTTTYSYNDNGNLVQHVDAKNQKIAFTYDTLGRILTKQVYNNKNDAAPTKTVTYTYDESSKDNSKGRLTTVDSLESIQEFSYDATGAGKEKKVVLDIDGNGTKGNSAEETLISRATYDAVGRIDEVTYPDGSLARHNYRVTDGSLYFIEMKESGQTTWETYATYDPPTALGALVKVDYKNETGSNYTYDEVGRLTTSDIKKVNYYSALLSFGYEWNEANKLLGITDNVGKGLGQTFKSTTNSSYDNRGRLLKAQGFYGSKDYAYDATGNLTRQGAITYAYDDTLKKHQATKACEGGVCRRIKYDANGNLVNTNKLQLTLTNAVQISNYSSSSSLAGVAIDGNTSGAFNDGSVTHTNSSPQAWWQAETSVESPFGVVTIYNRTDCCGDRLSDFYLIVSKDPFGSKSLADLLNEVTDRTKAVHFPGVAGAQVSLNIGGFRGKYVRVQLNGTNYLSLAEVKVGVSSAQLALTNAVQINNYSSSFLAGVAIDGNTSVAFNDGSVTHTNSSPQAWWQAETSVESPFGVVTIYHGQDCCGDRLSDFFVIVSKDPFGTKTLLELLGEDTDNEVIDRTKEVHFDGVAGAQESFDMGGFRGKYVRVQLNGFDYLSLAEVEVRVLNAQSFVAYTYDAENRLIEIQENNIVVNKFTYDSNGNRISKTDYDADGTETLTSFYPFSLYEIVKKADGTQIHTKYLNGPQGVVAAISKKQSASLDGWLAYNTGTLLASMSDPLGSLDGLSQYLSGKIAQFSFYPFIGEALKTSLGFGYLALVFTGLPYLFVRSAARIRRRVVRGLRTSGVIEKPTAEHWRGPRSTNSERKPMRLWTAFGMLLIFIGGTVLAPTLAFAALTPGSNGPGVPEAGTILFFHHDHIGSGILVTDENGREVSQVAYEPYGQMDQGKSNGVDNFRPKFTGKEWDSGSSLYYFGARYYDPQLGRFTTPDPAGQFHSPYMYGSGDPLSGVDPDGRFFIMLTIILVGMVIGAYMGGAAVNHSTNPASWDWKSGKTWGGIAGGAAIGGLTAGAGFAAVAGVGVGVAAAGLSGAAATAATVGGTALAMGAIAGTANVAFSAMGGATGADLGKAFGMGFAMGFVMAVPVVGEVALVGMGGYDTYQFAKDPSVGNGIALGMDVLFIGMNARERFGRTGAAGGEEAEAKGCASFTENTEVSTEEGKKEIEDIKVGDEVWSYDEATEETTLKPVSKLFTRIAAGIIAITLGATTVEATPEHPFYVPDEGWVKAKDLEAGDKVLQRDGSLANVTALQARDGDVRVYNFEVADTHNYYVSDEEVLAHNLCDDTDAKDEALRYRGEERKVWISVQERGKPETRVTACSGGGGYCAEDNALYKLERQRRTTYTHQNQVEFSIAHQSRGHYSSVAIGPCLKCRVNYGGSLVRARWLFESPYSIAINWHHDLAP